MHKAGVFVAGLMGAALMAAGITSMPARSASAPESSLLPERVEQAATARVAAGEYPALVIAVVDRGKSRVYGFGKLADGSAPDAQTVFEIGSVTKTFTGLLLARAVRGGSVQLDEPVENLLPGFSVPARDGRQITLENLADQHSGLPRLPTNFQPADPANPYADYDAADLKTFLASYQLPRDPGSEYEYSNLGFGLLGYALAKHAGTTYGEVVNRQILRPLQMSMTGVTPDKAMRAQLAVGHDELGKVTANWKFGVLAGAGALKSDAADLLRYLEANMGVLKTPLNSAMQFAQEPRAVMDEQERVGLAWVRRRDAAGDVIWHNGLTGGYASFIGFSADGKRGVVVLTNIQQSVDDLGFATLLADQELAPAETTISLPPGLLDNYVGSYRLAPHFILTVFRRGDQLFAQATGQGALPIFPSAKDEFFAKAVDLQISFARTGKGKIEGLVLHQHGDHSAPRISAAEAASAAASGKTIVKLPAATLREYVGHYWLAPGAVFDVTSKGGQLYVQLSGQASFPVYASSKDKFFYTVVDAQLSFVRDDDGKVVALVLHQNGRDQRAPRMQD